MRARTARPKFSSCNPASTQRVGCHGVLSMARHALVQVTIRIRGVKAPLEIIGLQVGVKGVGGRV